ncbi:His-rich protein BRANT [Bradyrhizobium prioriisuperbiae]|uniref:His-rich protein BRANT n=1 Tax=Bradyrhizobium prioriisuperbiae TaxID=2854389 RepID=UPI0028EAD602|nr:hypothetical protein [Bradyrhizobium prioritasuperba]
MFKTISAALLAASIIAAPAMAAGTVKSDVAPVTKLAPTAKVLDTKVPDAKVLDAKASMRKHVRHRHHIRHHRSHKHSVVFKKHTIAHVAKPAIKRVSSAKPVAAKIRG